MKIKKIIILFVLLILYLMIGTKFNILIKCPIHEIFHVYCPGCGITRMLISILKLNFYQAFRYNQLLFILLPFSLLLLLESIYSDKKKKKSLYNKIPNYIWYVLIIILLIYGIIRNVCPYFAPITLNIKI